MNCESASTHFTRNACRIANCSTRIWSFCVVGAKAMTRNTLGMWLECSMRHEAHERTGATSSSSLRVCTRRSKGREGCWVLAHSSYPFLQHIDKGEKTQLTLTNFQFQSRQLRSSHAYVRTNLASGPCQEQAQTSMYY